MSEKEFKNLIEKIKAGLYTEERLDLHDQGLDDVQIKVLVTAIKENPGKIDEIDLSWNNIKDKGASELAKLQLMKLNLSCNKIGSEGASSLSKAKIVSLNLSGNEIGVKGAAFFSDSEHITTLSLSECSIGDEGAQAVLKNKKLEIVDLSTNRITDKGLEKISSESSLTELDLSQNSITSKGAQVLARHEKIEKLRLASNWLGDAGIEPFIKNDRISELDLMQNFITGRGFLSLFKNKNIKKLDLFNNDISFKSTDSLSDGVSSLTDLGLGHNKLSSRCKGILQKLVSIPTLEHLDLVGNNIDDVGASILYKYRASTLKEIRLSSNPIKDEELIKKGLELSLP